MQDSRVGQRAVGNRQPADATEAFKEGGLIGTTTMQTCLVLHSMRWQRYRNDLGRSM